MGNDGPDADRTHPPSTPATPVAAGDEAADQAPTVEPPGSVSHERRDAGDATEGGAGKDDASPGPAGVVTAGVATVGGRPTGRRGWLGVRRATVLAHRSTALTLGLLLVVVTATGAAVLYTPEWTRWTNGSAFHVTDTDHPVPASQAMTTVAKAHPSFDPGSVNVYSGLYEVFSADEDANPGFYGVDPGTGHITGWVNPDRGVMAFLAQVHECLFTCDDRLGFISALNYPVPTLGMHWLTDVTWGGFVLGVLGPMLLLMGVSGIWLWWPGIRRWRHGFRVRAGKGR